MKPHMVAAIDILRQEGMGIIVIDLPEGEQFDEAVFREKIESELPGMREGDHMRLIALVGHVIDEELEKKLPGLSIMPKGKWVSAKDAIETYDIWGRRGQPGVGH